MLYQLLYSLKDELSWLNVFRYQTFRAMAAFLLAFFLVLFLQPMFIRKLRARGIAGQPIREEGPKDHYSKKGTPTMGGLVIIFAVVVATLLLTDLSNKFVWISLAILVGYACLGFIDDWRKITKQNSKGVSGPAKLFWQTIIAAGAASALVYFDFPTDLTVPFFKTVRLDLAYFFIPFVTVVLVGTSNAVNLTDGLDGLAIGSVMTVAMTYAVFAYLTGNVKISEYLQLTSISGAGEMAIILSAVFAAGLGFLWYNTFPAQVFMGDVGALALGGLLGFISVVVKQEVLLVLVGGVFVVEAVSVIIQRYYFKLTKKRFFKMAPIHHHFELLGWSEPKIIVRFWIISIVLALLSLTTLKLR